MYINRVLVTRLRRKCTGSKSARQRARTTFQVSILRYPPANPPHTMRDLCRPSVAVCRALRNEGMATAHLELVASTPQIVLSRDLVDIKPGKRVRIGVRWEGEPPAAGAVHHIEARAQDGSLLRVPVTLGQPGGPADDAADEEPEA